LPSLLTVEEVEKLVVAPWGQRVLPRRDRAILEVLYSTGIRVSELVALELDGLRGELVRVPAGKGAERIVPIGRAARHALKLWRITRASLLCADETQAVFISQRGGGLTTRAVEHLV